MQCNEYKLHHN